MNLSAAVSHTPQPRIVSLLEALARDLRFTFRSLRHNPGFTFTAVISLALGIGANTAIFSAVDAIWLRPPPIPHPNELVIVDVAASRLTQYGGSSYLDLADFRSRSRAFEKLAISQNLSAGMTTGKGESQVVYGLLVSGSFLSTLQVEPALGRDFRPEEDEVPGKYPVVIISHNLWTRAFANDKNIIGTEIKLNGRPFTIIGVTPESFTGTSLFARPDIYAPAMMARGLTSDGDDMLTHRSYRGFDMIGRLKPGVTLAQAQAEMNAIMRDLERTYPDTNKDTAVYLRREMERRLSQGFRLPAVLLSLTLLVLLIACANVAGLLMARSTTRMREISTQLAVGASRGSLIRQLLTESTVLALLGAVSGVSLGYVCIRGFATMLPYSPFPGGPEFRLDLRVLTYALLASMLVVFLCGLAPAFSAVKEAMLMVTSNVRGSAAEIRPSSAFVRRVLIVGQILLSTVLLIAAGLFLKAFARAQQANLGFNPDHMLLVMVDPGLRGYSNEKGLQFQQQFLEHTANLPGVTSASLATCVPFLNGDSWDISVDGYNAPGGESFIDTRTNQVAPDYFKTMQIPLLAGREFTAHDSQRAPLVAVVNETFARNYIVGNGPLEKALGHNFRLRDRDHISIVGVVKDSLRGGFGSPASPVFYMAYAQMGTPNAVLHVSTAGDPAAMTGAIRGQLRKLDPEVAPLSVVTFRTVVSSQGLFFPRVTAVLVGAFGLVALSLAVVGIYGVVSFMVGRRTQEIGVRMALGAQQSRILRMVLANGLSLVLAGLLLGGFVALLVAPLIGGLLIDVNPRDPAIFVGIAIVLIAATLGASWIPARRATRVNPIDALRSE
ncbi:MAG TPA: ABC transporter permease [Candidatus Sulfotelmatobacter sp.]|nr:ABC transporter permease [Candidatus Sulfotelmatobacter sp.]